MIRMWETFPNLTRAVREAHESRKMARGHDFDHALGVAELACRFCDWSFQMNPENAWAAGMCHNADRILAVDSGSPRREVPDTDVEALVREWLDTEPGLRERGKRHIVRAVLEHGKPNDLADNAVTIALKDADRVVNARLDVVIRSAQFHSDMPAFHPSLLLDDKRGKYNGRLTVVADLMDCLDWGNLEDERFGCRTPEGRRMIVLYVAELRAFLKKIVEQRREEGLVPYPEGFIAAQE